ncbi:MAG: primosomal protein N' [Pyrinomonadaceae bacterium]|nr:primosomal protein N' [Pyrinomonadaceae bacterium]
MESFSSNYAEVALPVPIRKTFSYILPSDFRDKVRLGSRLVVPFGKRSLTGYVVALYQSRDEMGESTDEEALKEAVELLDEEPLLTPEILELTRWAADYYLTSWGEFLKASLPAGVNSRIERIVSATQEAMKEFPKMRDSLKAKILRFLIENGESDVSKIYKVFGKKSSQRVINELEKQGLILSSNRILQARTKPKLQKMVRLIRSDGRFTEAQQRVISILVEEKEVFSKDLIKRAKISASVLKGLEEKGFVEIFEKEVYRDPLRDRTLRGLEDVVLNEDQKNALAEICKPLQKNEYGAFLLHGVTGSGKTIVYIRAIEETLRLGRSSLVLVPEIALTPAFSEKLVSAFGNQVALLHSSLSAGERFDEWRRIKAGKAKVVIGTRSAIFAPLKNIGLIVVDEEHDSSYRQQETPPYNARDLAVVRAKLADAVVILGSATPSLESFRNAELGKYKYLCLPERVKKRSLAKVEIVDMEKVYQKEGEAVVSTHLLSAIEETLNRGNQVIILLNRRGFSQFVHCVRCKDAIRCKHCDITLTYHKKKNILLCHYCNFHIPVSLRCPSCGFDRLFFVGSGVEKIEEILRSRFPKAKLARLDRDTVQNRESLEKTLRDFAEGRIDILVGTQMVAKGHDFPKIALVGVVSVDNILTLPDFRAGEKAFQLLTQVAGRSGRGDVSGRVIVQTFYPENYVIRFASEQNYEKFYQKEAEFRQRFMYPPFSSLACVLIQHKDYNQALRTALCFKSCLDEANLQKRVQVLDVSPAPISKLKDKYRLQIIVKAPSGTLLHQTLNTALMLAEEKKCDSNSVQIDVDPASLI